jgi:hypothetical protein
MNKFTVAALGITLAFGAIFPSIAQTSTSATSEQPLAGKVASVEKSEVTVQFPDNQTETYRVDPALLTAMNLNEGSTVNFSNRKLGTITNVSRYSVTVEFANGDKESYLLTEEGRRTLTFGDRVVVTPDLQLARAENYLLTAADVQIPYISASSSVTPDTSQPAPSTTPTPTVPAEPTTPEQPVTPAPVSPATPATPNSTP